MSIVDTIVRLLREEEGLTLTDKRETSKELRNWFYVLLEGLEVEGSVLFAITPKRSRRVSTMMSVYHHQIEPDKRFTLRNTHEGARIWRIR